MTRKHWILIAALVILGGAYVRLFTDWLVPPKIQIEVTTRPTGRSVANGGALPTLFMLDREYSLEGLKVVAVSNVPPSLAGKPSWQLAATSKTRNQRGFAYGEELEGFKVVIPPVPLVPGGLYQIEIKSGRREGTRSFTAIAPAIPPTE